MQSLYDIPAPAKLNLFLHITGRRADGYHLLQSVFMLIDWHDTLHFELRNDSTISREDLGWKLPDDDLVIRAAKALQTASQCAHGVHIGVHKSIPAQAGMGGGSSDAASTLLALNRLWKLNLPLTTLLRLGLTLGADVPFFLGGHNAWVEGIGDQITPIALDSAQFIVVKPATGLETQRIFAHPELKRNTEPAIISGFAANALCFGRNDLQPIAMSLCPEIGVAIEWLQTRGLSPRMTGSGSAVFAYVKREVDLNGAPGELELRLCRSLTVHPLLGWAD